MVIVPIAAESKAHVGRVCKDTQPGPVLPSPGRGLLCHYFLHLVKEDRKALVMYSFSPWQMLRRPLPPTIAGEALM